MLAERSEISKWLAIVDDEVRVFSGTKYETQTDRTRIIVSSEDI